MIQIRKNCFETNSSSTHCLSIIKRDIYNDWRNHSIALSIHYLWSHEDRDEKLGTDVKPTIKLPENSNDIKQAIALAKQLDKDCFNEYCYSNLSYGDNGFMRTNGNFDTYAPIIRVVDASKAVEENVKILREYIKEDKEDNWYVNYLKESNQYDEFLSLIDEYEKTGVFTEEMYKKFPNYLFYTPEEYKQMLMHDDCYSPFIHVYEDVVAMGYYFHS